MDLNISEVVKNSKNFALGNTPSNNNTTTSSLEMNKYFPSPKICPHLLTSPIY